MKVYIIEADGFAAGVGSSWTKSRQLLTYLTMRIIVYDK